MPVAYAGHMDTLAEHFRVIAPDTRGCGKTVHSGGPISFDLLADDVAALIDALDLERPDRRLQRGRDHRDHPRNPAPRLDPRARQRRRLRRVRPPSADDRADAPDPRRQPDATEPDPDAAARGFEASEQMRAIFELMKRDQDDGQGEGHWREYLRLSWDRCTQDPGYTNADL